MVEEREEADERAVLPRAHRAAQAVQALQLGHVELPAFGREHGARFGKLVLLQQTDLDHAGSTPYSRRAIGSSHTCSPNVTNRRSPRDCLIWHGPYSSSSAPYQ